MCHRGTRHIDKARPPAEFPLWRGQRWLPSSNNRGAPYQPQYDQPRGDWYGRLARFRGYPEFRQIEAHIREEINDGAHNDLLAPEDVADFNQQLRAIQLREQQEYRAHGWDLPQDDRAAIRSQLDTLDSLVDQTRDEP